MRSPTSGIDRRFAAGIALVLLIQVVVASLLLRRSYFFAEDFTFLAANRDVPLSYDFLTTSVFGHLIPGFLLVQKYVGDWFGASWTAAVVVTLAVQVAGTVAFARMLVALVGRRTWWVVWLTAAFGLSVVGLNTVPWWAATLTIQVTLAACVSTWGCALRFERSRHWVHLVSLAVMYAVALAFFEKAMVTSAYLGLFVLVVGLRDGDTFDTRVRRAIGLWQVWAVIAAVTLVDLVIYVRGPYLEESGDPAGARLTAEYLARTLPEGTFPSLIGAVHPVSTIPGPDVVTVVVATAVAVGLMVWTSLRSSLALRAWGWYLGVVLISQGVVARGRLNLFDIDIVLHNLRYQGDSVYLFLIATAVAVPAAVRGSAPAARRQALVAAAVAPLLALPLWVQSVQAISTESPGDDSREYFRALREDDVPTDVRFLDMAVPEYLVPSPMTPWNLASRIYPVIRPGVRITHDPDGASWITPDGTVRPVALQDLTAPTTPGCLEAGSRKVEVVADPGPGTAGLVAPLLLAFDYRADGPTSFAIGVAPAGAGPPRVVGSAVQVDGAGEVAVPVALAAGQAVFLKVTGDAGMCLDRVRVAGPTSPS